MPAIHVDLGGYILQVSPLPRRAEVLVCFLQMRKLRVRMKPKHNWEEVNRPQCRMAASAEGLSLRTFSHCWTHGDHGVNKAGETPRWRPAPGPRPKWVCWPSTDPCPPSARLAKATVAESRSPNPRLLRGAVSSYKALRAGPGPARAAVPKVTPRKGLHWEGASSDRSIL